MDGANIETDTGLVHIAGAVERVVQDLAVFAAETPEQRSARIQARYDAERRAFEQTVAGYKAAVSGILPTLQGERLDAAARSLAQADGDWGRAHDYAQANRWNDLADDLVSYAAALAAVGAGRSAA